MCLEPKSIDRDDIEAELLKLLISQGISYVGISYSISDRDLRSKSSYSRNQENT